MGAEPRLIAAVTCLLGGHLLLGVSHIAMLPPWEGFDETAHYSYLQQLTDTGTLPQLGSAKISAAVERYARLAPIRYSSVAPVEQNGGLTYRTFFESPAATVARGKAIVHDHPPESRRYTPGTGGNWEAQHPPLYYLLLVPVYLATRHLGWGPHLFALRLTSYLLAWLALALGAHATIRWVDVGARRTDGTSVALGVALWPILFPSWFPEMARLGNDSLCALIMAGIWWLTARTLRASCSVGYAATVGILLGMGALTKALFIPVAVGIGAFWCVRCAREGHRALGRTLAAFSLAFLLATAIAAWWYVGNWRQYGEPLGSLEMILLRQAGGLVTGLSDRFSLLAWVRGHAAAVTTFAWSGTWSHARPPYLFLAPLAAVVLITAGAYVAVLPRFRPGALAWLPVFIATPVLAGLSYHVLVRIALTGEGRGTGGYYLHFLAAPLGVALGLGFDAWSRSCAFRKVLGASLVYVLVFSVVISWAQVMLWSGWFFKAGASNFYQVPAHLPPLLGLPDALHRLEALAFPGSGAAAWIVGGLLLLSGLLAGLSRIGRVRIG